MATSRVVLNLEPPTNDGELLEAATHAMGVLNGLADQFEQWADMLGSFNLPRPVLDAFAQIPDGLRTAAEGAHQGARLFEEHFEESRDVASRGLHITGQDAA